MTVYGIGIDFAIIQWTAAPLVFTPETYSVEYREATHAGSFKRLYVSDINSNFSSSNTPQYTEILQNLKSNTMYTFEVVIANSYGETRSKALTFLTLLRGNT